MLRRGGNASGGKVGRNVAVDDDGSKSAECVAELAGDGGEDADDINKATQAEEG